MIILKGIYDSDNKRLMINFSCNLLREYYEIFEALIDKYKKSGNLQSDLEIQRLDDSKCIIIIPIEIPEASGLGNGERVTGVPKNLIEKITSILENFRNLALEKELGSTEFIPLQGYPIENLKVDIIEAIKNKRNFCLIDKYSNYEKFSRHEITKLHQYKVRYSSDDYSEIALYIHEGNMKSLREHYTSKLEEIDWEE